METEIAPEIPAAAKPDQWLTLTDYSSKYRVSISTLRRRIKANQIAHQFSAGKYLLQDVAPTHEEHMPESITSSEFHVDAHEPAAHSMSEKLRTAATAGGEMSRMSVDAEPILSTATKLLNELKKAYMSILQEKEEQMIQLKEEVADLKTLVRVLEQENDRQRLQLHARMNQ